MKKVLLLLMFLFGTIHLKAQITFDEITSVPSNWTTTSSSGNLTLSTTRFKSGTKALKWIATNDQILTANDLLLDSSQTGNSSTSITSFYIYTNTNSASDTLLVQFLNPSGAVQRTGTIVLNFTGWREYHRDLITDYGGGNALSGFDLSAVKFTFKKKSGTTGSRQIWIDQINWVDGDDTESWYPGPHLLVDNSQFEVTSSLRAGQPLTSWLNTPDISLVTPTSTQLLGIDTLKKRYNIIPTTSTAPNVTAAELSEARAYYKYCGPSLSSGTLYYTRGLLSDSNQDSLVKFSKYCNIFARKYFYSNAQSDLDTLTLFTRYLIDQGMAEGGRNVMETNAYTNARTFNNNFLIVVPLISDATVKSDLIKMLKWSNEYNKIYSNQFLVRNNMDFVHLKLEYIIKLALLSNDNAEIVRDLKSIDRFMTQVMEPGDGGRDGIKPDGLGFHHRSKYLHYMYAYGTWIDHAYNLRGTPFKISKDAYEYMLKAVKTLLLETNRGVVRANSTSGRFPFSQSVVVNSTDFRNLVKVGGDIIGQSAEPEAAALYNYFYKITYYTGVPAINLDGFHQFNYGQLGIKRTKNWVAIAKGLTDKMFGAEIYANANRYGRYQGYGALDILYESAAATGYISGGNGWDWNMMPGTTSVHLENYIDLRPPSNSTRDEYQGKSFAGALSAGNDGVFAMDFVQDAGTRYTTDSLTFRKSVFAFDSILVCLGSKINGIGGNVATNLFQSIHSSSSTNLPIFINSSTPQTSAPSTPLPTTSSNWIVNGQTTGFFIPAGNNQIQLFRGTQTTPINTSNTPTNTASANASKAWINHGSKPSNATYQYVVVPGTTPAKMQALSDAINQGDVYEVLANNLKYHAVRYKPNNTTGYSFFEGDSSINIGYIEKVTNNCLITTKELGDTLIVRIANPDLNTVPNPEPSVDWDASTSSVNVTLSRRWRFLQSSTPGSTNTVSHTNFVNSIKLDFKLDKGNYTEVKLVKDQTEMGYGVWNNVEEAIWAYDLSTTSSGSITYNTASTSSVSELTASPAGFLPYPPSPSKARVGLGSSGNGSFEKIGTGDNKKIRVYASSTSLNKLSAYDIGDKSVVSTFFTLTFGANGTNGNWILGLGNNAITNVFTSASNLSSSTSNSGIFSAFRFDLGNTNNISFKYRKVDGGVPSFVEIDNTTFIKGAENFVELYSNNSSYSSSYTRNNATYTVNAQCYHLWVNGVRISISGGSFQIPSTELAVNENINSFFITSSGNTLPTANTATLKLADMQMRYEKPQSGNLSVNLLSFEPKLNPDLPSNLKVYPNPASEQVTASFYSSVNKVVDISLVNTVGVVCLKMKELVNIGANQVTIDTKQLIPGLYIINVDDQRVKLIIN